MTERFEPARPRLLEAEIDGLLIVNGLNDNLAAQIIKKSKQQAIKDATPKDAAQRFKNPESLEQWLAKGREVYTLTAGDDLAGLVWFGKKEFPFTVPPGIVPPNDTFAIRMYNRYRGKGLALPFMWHAMRDYRETLRIRGEYEEHRGIWLSTNSANKPATGLYDKFGFNPVGFVDGQFVMVLPHGKMEQILGA